MPLLDIERRYQNDELRAWRPDSNHAAAFAGRNNHPLFALSAAPLMQDTKKEVFLYRALITTLKQINPSYTWKAQYQQDGTCVGQGGKLGADTLEAIQHVFNGTKWYGRCSVAGCYAGSRVDIGGQPGSWQGSNGSWLAEYFTKIGMLMLKDIGLPEDAMRDDEVLALKWTRSREGIPKDYETAARRFPIQTASLVTTFEEAAAAIQNGYPVVTCSSRIPSGKRDSQGFSPASNRGGHCTLYWGVRWDRPGLLYQNSWSNDWGSGAKYPEDQPDGSVWLTADEVNKALAARDTYVISHANGFEKQKLNFRLI